MSLDLRSQKELMFPRVDDAQDTEDLKDVIRELVEIIRQLHQNMTGDTETIFETVGTGYSYFGEKGPDGWPDGTWRIGLNSNRLSFERKESGTWVEKGSSRP